MEINQYLHENGVHDDHIIKLALDGIVNTRYRNPEALYKWTGHSDYQAMKPYIEIAEQTKANAMKLFEDKFSK